MGIMHVKSWVANPSDPARRREIEFLVDSGAIYTVIPRSALSGLEIVAHSRRTLTLSDGRQVTWEVGNAVFTIGERQGASTVVFGEESGPSLLGIATLEELGLGLDPLRRELIPIPLPLMALF